MATKLPLPTLLSKVLVAFTIEFDNEFEHRMPHRTTWGPAAGSRRGPWLVSQVMWSNFMRFVSEEGTRVGELDGPARMTNLNGMQRWGYVVVEPDVADRRPSRPRSEWIIRPTSHGERAQEIWRPLAAQIQERWRHRYGAPTIDGVLESLRAVQSQLDVDLPPYLPVLAYANGMFAEVEPYEGWRSVDLDLSVLLAHVLLAFTLDFEEESALSLAVAADAVRVLGAERTRVRDLPRLTGVSKEAIGASLGWLEKRSYVMIEPDPTASRVKAARLTSKGVKAQDVYRRRLGVIEERWQARFGSETLGALRESLEGLVGAGTDRQSPLFQGLEPYPDGWRASVRTPDTLPHHPMVLHRGGYPDGS